MHHYRSVLKAQSSVKIELGAGYRRHSRARRALQGGRSLAERNERRAAPRQGTWGLEREHTHVRVHVIDLSNDLAAATRERQGMNSRTLTAAESRENARVE
jgi:hypothetical protein